MNSIKKALIISVSIHLVGLLGGELLLRKGRPKRTQVLYPIRLINIAESSTKTVLKTQFKTKPPSPPPKPIPKPKPKRDEKILSRKSPNPKKGVPLKEKKELKKEAEDKAGVSEKAQKDKERKDEARKISQAINQIKKTLENKGQDQPPPFISKEFVERQKQIYAARIDKLIKEHWSIPKTFLSEIEELEAIVVLSIKTNGDLGYARLEKSSGFKPFDESTIRAIKKAVPFPPPPVDLKDEEFEIRFYSNQTG